MGLLLANEDKAAFYAEDDQLLDRKRFVENLGWLLSQTRENVIGCELESAGSEEIVWIQFKNGYQRPVNVHMDSYMAIVRDVSKHV